MRSEKLPSMPPPVDVQPSLGPSEFTAQGEGGLSPKCPAPARRPHSHSLKAAEGPAGSPKYPDTECKEDLEGKGDRANRRRLSQEGQGLALLTPMLGNFITHGWWDTESPLPPLPCSTPTSIYENS